jgi:hypothetical protein
MMVFLLTLIIMLLVAAGIAVGVIFGRKPLAGSCGGVGKALAEPDYVCDLCGGDEAKCEEQKAASYKASNDSLSYDASKPKE